ncbi:hypothetical protein LEP1GSC074_1126 [Leptospira noguchii str. Hook]|nr:hypothetical protein LEP1GSC074_1126 [Leptospira noguchii str. Hook]
MEFYDIRFFPKKKCKSVKKTKAQPFLKDHIEKVFGRRGKRTHNHSKNSKKNPYVHYPFF